MATVKSNIHSNSALVFGPSVLQYFHCGGIQTIAGHVGATRACPFHGSQRLVRHGCDGCLASLLLQLGGRVEQAVLQARLALPMLRNGGDTVLHLESKLKGFLENSSWAVYRNSACKSTLTLPGTKK